MFIELTDKIENRPVSINIKNILIYRLDGLSNNTLIEFGLDSYVVVKESYEQVKELIAEEVSAERGY